MSKEFDDVKYVFTLASSEKARNAISALMTEHDLVYLNNPGGGGVFLKNSQDVNSFRCQVAGCNDVEDYYKLKSAIETFLKS